MDEEVDGLPFSTDPEQSLMPHQAAQLFDVSTATVQRWAREGKIPYFRMPSGRVRYSRVWCDAYLQRQGVA